MIEYFLRMLADSARGSFEFIVICIYIGFLIGGGLMIYDKRVMGNFIRTLIEKDATSPEKALTLAQLGYDKKRPVISALRGRGMFASLVYEASDKLEFTSENHALPVYRGKFDVNTSRFYLPEELKYRASVRFEKKGTHIMALVIAAIVFGAVLIMGLLVKDRIAFEIEKIFGNLLLLF